MTKEEWLMPGAVVPVDPDTTKALVDEIKRLIGVVGGMALQARSAPVQEPVAWFKHGPYEDGEPLSVVFENPHDDVCYSPLGFIDTPPAAQPAPVHFAWMRYEADCAGDPVLVLARSTEEGAFKVYKEPPAAQRQWVGLTYEDMVSLQKDLHDAKGEVVLPTTFAQAIEAKLKERNVCETR